MVHALGTRPGDAMRLKKLALACGLLTLGGCADLVTGLATYNDQMAFQNGNYFEDDYDSMEFGNSTCGGWGEQGVTNNQGYARVSNTGQRPGNYTLVWSTGSETEVWLEAGEQSQIYYMTPSVTVATWRWQCS